jgi:5-formyltetrahydrofolate cyclo-ligase
VSLGEEKAGMRARALAQRTAAASDAGAAREARASIAAVMRLVAEEFGAGAAVLSGYMPMRSEIDPLPAMRAHAGPVCVPVVTGRAQPLVFHRWTPEMPMVEGSFKALIPAVAEEIVPEILLVPLLAFDRRGYRLGYGGGFYDRTLAGLRANGTVRAIGLAFAAQEVDEVPCEPTDARLDAIVAGGAVIWPG